MTGPRWEWWVQDCQGGWWEQSPVMDFSWHPICWRGGRAGRMWEAVDHSSITFTIGSQIFTAWSVSAAFQEYFIWDVLIGTDLVSSSNLFPLQEAQNSHVYWVSVSLGKSSERAWGRYGGVCLLARVDAAIHTVKVGVSFCCFLLSVEFWMGWPKGYCLPHSGATVYAWRTWTVMWYSFGSGTGGYSVSQAPWRQFEDEGSWAGWASLGHYGLAASPVSSPGNFGYVFFLSGYGQSDTLGSLWLKVLQQPCGVACL